jgi:hypothetical protein
VIAAIPAVAAAEPEKDPGARWSLLLGGGALAPVGEMRDTYQDALIAGMRFGVRARVGIGVQLAVDYSPLPRRESEPDEGDTSYGTVALVPAWTFGRKTVRLQLGVGGGVALEHSADVDAYAPAALGQVGLEFHVTQGGGIVLLAGATKTFGDLEYQYGWGMAALAFEF